jgi:aminopeptidase N
MPCRSSVRLAMALVTAALPATIANAQPRSETEPAPGTGIDVIAHDLEITPDFTTKSLGGRARIRLLVTDDGLRELAFSRNALTIDAALLDGRSVAARQGTSSLVFTAPRPLRRGQTVTLTIAYRGQPARGITFADNAVFTSYWACDWMICSQDVPSDKASFQLRLVLPAGIQSLSVGTRRGVRPGRGGRAVHLWREDRPYSAYLYGFAAGPFTETVRQHGSHTLSLLAMAPAAADPAPLLDTTAAMVRFLEDKAGLPLPVGRYTQLIVPGTEAQEAATYSLIGARHLETARTNPDQEWAMIHELAHQWWGNLVSARTWDHFWLNEGVATFITAAWKEHRFGRAAYDAELEVARGRLARARALGFDKPLAYPGAYPSLAARRAVQYSKGALFLDHLRTTLGDPLFWRALRRFTRAHAGGVADSRDFQRAFEQEAGRDLSATFDRWVFGPSVRIGSEEPSPSQNPLPAQR